MSVLSPEAQIETTPATRSLTVLFDVSNKCNLRCRMCYFSYDSVFLRRALFMTPETFEHIANSVLPSAHTVYLSAGSESLTNPDFIEILRIAARFAPPRTKLLTNGLLLTPEIGAALIECGVSHVDFSVDGATRETYQHIRRGGDFDLLRRNIRRLADDKRARGSARPVLQFNVTLMKSNLGELERFVDLAVELGVEQIACRHLMLYEGLGMEGETTIQEPLRTNERLHAMLDYATRAGVAIVSFPDYFTIDGQPWTPPLHAADRERFGGDAPAAPNRPPQPFGRVDLPPESRVEARASVELAGWALDMFGIARVEVMRDAARGDRRENVDSDGRVHVAWAQMHNGSRPDVAAVYRDVPRCHSGGWTFELQRAALPEYARAGARVHAIAHSLSGERALLGTREVAFGTSDRAQPFIFCRKPFDNVYVDSTGGVYPHPDCQTLDAFGSLAKSQSFHEIWTGPEFSDLRRRIIERDPPRMCRTCPDFINRSVDDANFFRERQVEHDFLLPAGFLDHPPPRYDCAAPILAMRGWALSFAGLERIEILREPVASDAREAMRDDGLVALGAAQVGAHARPDVATLYSKYPDRENAGWSFDLHRSELPGRGPFVIRVLAHNRAGGHATIGSSIVRFLHWTLGAIDLPADGSVVRSPSFDVIGWALSESGTPRVVVRRRARAADRRELVRADGFVDLGVAGPHDMLRSDVAAAHPQIAGSERSAWRVNLKRADFPDEGMHEIAAFVEQPGAADVCLGSRTITFAGEAP